MTLRNLFNKKLSSGNLIFPQGERERLQKMERYNHTETTLCGNRIKVPDAASFLSSLKEIFVEEIYKFQSDVEMPLIIDCGANIGLSVIYFKQQFPGSIIIAFEPDPLLFKAMQYNLDSFGFKDVICRNEAISNSNGEVFFDCEGGHSGMVIDEAKGQNIVTCKSVRLRHILQEYERIEFLKIDIEGYEIHVIPDIGDELKKVEFLFLEYHSFLGKDQELGKILNIIKAAGFRYYLKEAYPKPFPFINRELFLNMDFLVNIFCYKN